MDNLPKRKAGTHLPPEAYRAKIPTIDPHRWYVDDKTVMLIVNALQRWQLR